MRWILLAPALLALVGCAQYRAQVQAQLDAAKVAQEARDDQTCRSYGTRPGSAKYFDCRMQLDKPRTLMMQER